MPEDRYDVSGLAETQFEPGSRGRVLRNLLGINRKRDMDRAEAEAQHRAFDTFSTRFEPGHRFIAADILQMHRYGWAGSISGLAVSGRCS